VTNYHFVVITFQIVCEGVKEYHMKSKFLFIATYAMLFFAFSAKAVVVYSVSFEGVLNNDGLGVWEGDLNVGINQNLNLTVEYSYLSYTVSYNSYIATFPLLGLQVFDNTNGLASDFLSNVQGTMRFCYDGVVDFNCGASTGVPAGGSLVFSDARGEFGSSGNLLPTGAAFDLLVESTNIRLIARAGSSPGGGAGTSWKNNIFHVNSSELLSGGFTFRSSYSPDPNPNPNLVSSPTSLALLILGLGGVGFSRRKAQ
jgi:hypothetical protein